MHELIIYKLGSRLCSSLTLRSHPTMTECDIMTGVVTGKNAPH